uniref:Uncharacterized protein n=1 Tax=Molossus molossus TaxID=27622 RepID=A0A7J8CS65_MOLMO|nr:hypothetical protein HJG59_009810 [Molossus molossus]
MDKRTENRTPVPVWNPPKRRCRTRGPQVCLPRSFCWESTMGCGRCSNAPAFPCSSCTFLLFQHEHDLQLCQRELIDYGERLQPEGRGTKLHPIAVSSLKPRGPPEKRGPENRSGKELQRVRAGGLCSHALSWPLRDISHMTAAC